MQDHDILGHVKVALIVFVVIHILVFKVFAPVVPSTELVLGKHKGAQKGKVLRASC